MFSINYKSSEDGTVSYIYFGGYENEYAKSDSDIVWLDINEAAQGHWDVNCTGIYYGESTNSLGSIGYVTLDTGTPNTMIP